MNSINCKHHTSSPDKVLNIFLLVFLALMPVLVVIPKQVFFLISCVFVAILLWLKHSKFSCEKNGQIYIFLIFVFSLVAIVMSLIRESYPTERILAAVNTAFSWAIAGILYSFYYNSNLNKKAIRNSSLINLIVLFILTLIYLLNSSINLSFLGCNLSAWDLINGHDTTRFIGFFEYPNLVVPYTFINLFYFLKSSKFGAITVSVVLLSFLPILCARSRIGMVMICLFDVLYFLREVRVKFGKKYQLLVIVIILSVILLEYTNIYSLLQKIILMREGSNSTRLALYQKAIQMTFDKNLLFGVAIKIKYGEYPVGSHSTYIGLFYKCGLVGIALGALGIYHIFRNHVYKNNDAIEAFIVLLFGLFFILEDIDGTNWLITYFFIMLAMSNQYRNCKAE